MNPPRFLAQLARQWLTGVHHPVTLTPASRPRLAGVKRAGLYMHIPFCRTLCPYCPYNKVPWEPALARRYGEALLGEIDLVAAEVDDSFEGGSLCIGGGTPTLCMDLVSEATAAARSKLRLGGEACVETNPDACGDEVVAAMETAGISMVSLGVQSFQPALLAMLGRPHTPAMLEASIRRLLAAKFDAVNCDFLFAMPDQDDRSLLADLERAVNLGVEQITLYPLFTFPYSRVRRHRRRLRVRTPNLLRRRRQFRAIQRFFAQAGWIRSSIWSFRKTDVRKFSSATRRRYIGLGAGAGSCTDWGFTLNTFDVDAYIDRLAAGAAPTALETRFTADMHRCFWLYWRLYDTSAPAADVDAILAEAPRLALLWRVGRRLGWLRRQGDRYVLTDTAAFWLHLVQNHFILSDINTVWTRARTEAFPQRIRL